MVTSRKEWHGGIRDFIFFVLLWLASLALEAHVAFLSINMEIIVVLRIERNIPLKAEEVGMKWGKARHS